LSHTPRIFFITGASGVGKTTLVSRLEEKYGARQDWTFLHFDAIGVPSVQEMEAQFGSVENWQRATTRLWVYRMISEYPDKNVIIFEGQVNLDFVKSSFKECDFPNYKIVLVDCDEETMHKRLNIERMQPALITHEMDNWLRFLRGQAQQDGESIIDTDVLDRDQAVEVFESILTSESVQLSEG